MRETVTCQTFSLWIVHLLMTFLRGIVLVPACTYSLKYSRNGTSLATITIIMLFKPNIKHYDWHRVGVTFNFQFLYNSCSFYLFFPLYTFRRSPFTFLDYLSFFLHVVQNCSRERASKSEPLHHLDMYTWQLKTPNYKIIKVSYIRVHSDFISPTSANFLHTRVLLPTLIQTCMFQKHTFWIPLHSIHTYSL